MAVKGADKDGREFPEPVRVAIIQATATIVVTGATRISHQNEMLTFYNTAIATVMEQLVIAAREKL